MSNKVVYTVTAEGHRVLRRHDPTHHDPRCTLARHHKGVCLVPLDEHCPDCGRRGDTPHRCPGVER